MQYETLRPIGFCPVGLFCVLTYLFSGYYSKFANRGHAHRSSDERGKQITRLFADAKGGENVKPYSHEEHKRHAFDSFCKKVLRNEARDHYDEMKRQRDREVSFSELSAQEMDMLFVMDKYPSEQLFNYSKRKMTLVFSVGMCYTGVSNLFCVDCCSGREVGVFILAEF